jgi:hypothetical protein
VAKDGSDNKSSTIVQYSLGGKPQRKFSVPGHNDGLRVVGENNLWCLQNDDANPNLVVIDLESGKQKMRLLTEGATMMLLFRTATCFVTASNPNTPGGINIFPALVEATLQGSMVC